jgi:two-component system chemotaxis response regulator CheB
MSVTVDPAGAAGPKLRVLVVDDSVVMRRLIARVIEEFDDVEVAGTAANGRIALQKIPQVNPDVLILDIEMPDMDGLATLRVVNRQYPSTRVIMFSTLTHRGAAATLEALQAGASDYLAKPAGEGTVVLSLDLLRRELLPKIRQFRRGHGGQARPNPSARSELSTPGIGARQVVAIATSTGGPVALTHLLRHLPAGFRAPVLVVQHMPPMFTRLLAERLSAESGRNVVEASEGDVVEEGRILIAPGDYHMTVRREQEGTIVRLNQGTPENSCRPAADVLFGSVAETYGPAAIGVVLTGMGQDGRRGAALMRHNGAWIVAQDAATSVVWGMPGAVVEAGLADRVLPLDEIAAEIARHFNTIPSRNQRGVA